MADIHAVLESYVDHFNAGDAASWSELFAENARQEDPVGSPVNEGRAAIRGFFDNVRSLGPGRITVERPPIIVGNEAILCFSVSTDLGGQKATVPLIVDHFVFDDSGAITSLRAFYDPASVVIV
jgi:steroid delta-isomerase